MYGKPPPLPPPIPNEPPSSFHPAPPPPPCQPPPLPPHNESFSSNPVQPSNAAPPSFVAQVRPPFPSNFTGLNYQQSLQYPIPYNAQQIQYGGDNLREPHPVRPAFVLPRPGFNPAIRPLMPPQFDQRPPQLNQNIQPLLQIDHNNQPSSQFDQNSRPSLQFNQNSQPSSQFDQRNQPSSQFDQNSRSLSQFDQSNKPSSQFDQNNRQFDHNNQVNLQFDYNHQPVPQFDHKKPTPLFDHNDQPPLQFDRNSTVQFDHNQSTQFGHNKQAPIQQSSMQQSSSRFDRNQPPSRYDHSQLPSRFDRNLSSQFERNPPPSRFDQNEPPSQLDCNKQSPYTQQFDHQRQYDHSQQQSVDTRRLPYYQLPSGSDSTGPKPLMDLPQVPLDNKEFMKESHEAGSSDQRPVADATVNNGNTNFHPVPCHIAAQHKPAAGQRRTLLPGRPHQWMPPHSERRHYDEGGGEDYYSSHHDPGPSDYPDDDYHQPYHSLNVDERENQPYHSLNVDEREREVEKPPPKTVSAEILFGTAEQRNRPTHFVIILRGLPGSGKSYAAKLIKEKELANEFSAPRILSLDDYFLVEVEKKVADPITGKKIKKKVTEYEYDAAMEEHYRASLFKSFNKTLDDGYFPVIVIDAINNKVSHFYQCWSAAKMKGFEVYVCEMNSDVDQCVSQNVHNRTVEEITQLKREWEEAPSHIIRLDTDSLLHETSETAIDEVEMAGVGTDSNDSPSAGSRVDQWIKQQQEDQASITVKSKWENLSLTGDDKLDQLDGFSRKRKRSFSIDDSSEISLTDYLNRQEKKLNKPGKKRVRWADLEAEKEKERRKEIGFHIGGEWTKISEEEAEGLLLGNSTVK